MFGCLEAVWLKSWIKRTEVMGAKRSLEDCRRGNSMIFQWCATESSQCLIIPRSEFDQTPKKLPRSSAKMFVSEECPNHKLFHVTLQLFVSVNASYHNDIMSRMMESRFFLRTCFRDWDTVQPLRDPDDFGEEGTPSKKRPKHNADEGEQVWQHVLICHDLSCTSCHVQRTT